MRKRCFCFITLLLALPIHLSAHPHSWVALKSEFILDSQGRLAGLVQHWEFDVYYSLMTIADMINEHGDKQAGLNILARDMAGNLKSYDYFTELTLDRQRIKLAPPKDYELSTHVVDGQEVLRFRMRFDIPRPDSIEHKSVSIRVFDPTYYVDMRHYDPANVIVHTQNGLECTTTVELPETSDELVEYAASLDKNQKDTQGLGQQFAEQVIVRCM